MSKIRNKKMAKWESLNGLTNVYLYLAYPAAIGDHARLSRLNLYKVEPRAVKNILSQRLFSFGFFIPFSDVFPVHNTP